MCCYGYRVPCARMRNSEISCCTHVQHSKFNISRMTRLKFLLSSSAACLLGSCGYCYFSGTPWFFSYVLMPSMKWVDPERAHRLGVCLAAKRLIPKERCKDDGVLVRWWMYTLPDCLNNLRMLKGKSPVADSGVVRLVCSNSLSPRLVT
jgi:hypothetical protein